MRIIIISLVLVLVATLGVLVAARNIINKPSPTPVQTVKTEQNACDLVTVDELKETMGAEPVVEQKSEQGENICLAVTEGNILTVQVQNSQTIKDSTGGDVTSSDAYYELQLSGTEKPQAIPELGDKAFWDGSQVWVLKGDTLVDVVYSDQVKTQNLSKKILSRL